MQPWHVHVLQGRRLAEIKAIMDTRVQEAPDGEGLDGEGVDYDIYPHPLTSPYLERRQEFGEALYGSMGVAKEDAVRRRQWHQRNFRFFDAPAALFLYIDRHHGRPQWADVGMYLMSIMLLLREMGLDSCPQECWARYAKTVDAFLGCPNHLMLFCGLAIGHADWSHPANQFESLRAEIDEFVTFHDAG